MIKFPISIIIGIIGHLHCMGQQTAMKTYSDSPLFNLFTSHPDPGICGVDRIASSPEKRRNFFNDNKDNFRWGNNSMLNEKEFAKIIYDYGGQDPLASIEPELTIVIRGPLLNIG